MRIAVIAQNDPANVRSWSGTTHSIWKELESRFETVVPIALPRLDRWTYKAAHRAFRGTGFRYYPALEPILLSQTKRAIAKRIRALQVDAVVSVVSPFVVDPRWAGVPNFVVSDATFRAMRNYYPQLSRLSHRTTRQWDTVVAQAIGTATACFYASKWAASSAIHDYAADPAKVHVLPFGANLPFIPAPTPPRWKVRSASFSSAWIGCARAAASRSKPSACCAARGSTRA